MKLKKIWLISLSLPIAFFSCAPVYVPNMVNTPMFSEKGELKASVGFGTAGTDPQLAYSITDNWAIMANGSFKKNTNLINIDSSKYHSHQFGELGVGYYEKISDIARFETFFGGGFGNSSFYSRDDFSSEYQFDIWGDLNETNFTDHDIQQADMIRFFLQPSIGITNKVFDGSVATRMVYLTLQNDIYTASAFYIEPVFTAKVGYKYIKWFCQFGWGFPIAGYSNSEQIPQIRRFNSTFGIQANLDLIKKKQE